MMPKISANHHKGKHYSGLEAHASPLGKLILARRKTMRIDLNDLAHRLGISITRLRNLIIGKSPYELNAHQVTVLCDALGISLEDYLHILHPGNSTEKIMDALSWYERYASLNEEQRKVLNEILLGFHRANITQA